jgi:hypothetical protein
MNLHPYRRNILFRWIASAALLAGVAALVTFVDIKQLLPQPQKPTVRKPPAITLPSRDDMAVMTTAIGAIRSLPDENETRLTAIPAKTLMPPEETVEKPELALSLLLLGNGRRAAVIDGNMYEEGENLPGGWSVLTISEEGVLLSGERSTELLAWEPLTQVELRREGDTEPTETTSAEEEEDEEFLEEEALEVDAAVSPEETIRMLGNMLKGNSGTGTTGQ